MNIKIGEKIKLLRKQKNISQEVLAQYLGAAFQAVSKWENETTMPDVPIIPAIASFFGVSTDELFSFNLPEIYFTKLELQAELLEGEEMEEAARKQLGISLDSAVGMAKLLISYYKTCENTTIVESYKTIFQSVVESAKILDSITN